MAESHSHNELTPSDAMGWGLFHIEKLFPNIIRNKDGSKDGDQGNY
jgi:hypothetical protein